ncbi:SET domain-containing protein 9-like [Orbicella faveolata]|uniref:SET domain-containing protein 9-like n=1 Tax=Orbicella faveolata TaxID=48498 RepID=UPI0009E6056A|nr:SET domain-containing protein 9-like [Orbicella faveolata]
MIAVLTRTVREVSSRDQDKTVPDPKVLESLLTVLHALHDNGVHSAKNMQCAGVMYNALGYEIKRLDSTIPGAGKGVFVTKGTVPAQSLVALYPGTIYWPYEPIMIQSIGNPFIFRCIDGILIDGNDKGLSKIIYRSNARRDQIGPYLPCDTTWLGDEPVNPLAVGQYVNNRTRNVPANVAYQEVDVPFQSIAPKLWKNLPNVWYSSGNIVGENAFLRMVALVSVDEINEGKEVFSSYFTVVH